MFIPFLFLNISPCLILGEPKAMGLDCDRKHIINDKKSFSQCNVWVFLSKLFGEVVFV